MYKRQFLDTVEESEGSFQELSVSRCSQRLQWGIPVPNDPSQVIYVWLDALANYLTVSGYPNLEGQGIWPPDVQIVGKDILKFHAWYWPAFLMAADIQPLPKQIRCHSHWLVDNKKMSKSRGNVVDPNDLIDRFSCDGVRYVLLREGLAHTDGNYNDAKMVRYANADLANTLGNLLNRCTASAMNASQEFVAFNESDWNKYATTSASDLRDSLDVLADKVEMHFEDFNYYHGLNLVLQAARDTNLFLQTEKPWELKKTDPERLGYVLNLSFESLRAVGILLQPVVPSIAAKLLNKLAVKDRSWPDAKKFGWNQSQSCNKSHSLSSGNVVLFKKIKS